MNSNVEWLPKVEFFSHIFFILRKKIMFKRHEPSTSQHTCSSFFLSCFSWKIKLFLSPSNPFWKLNFHKISYISFFTRKLDYMCRSFCLYVKKITLVMHIICCFSNASYLMMSFPCIFFLYACVYMNVHTYITLF